MGSAGDDGTTNRGRAWRVAIGVAIAAVAAAGVGLAVLAGGDGEPAVGTGPSVPTTATSRPTATPTPVAPERLTDASRLSLDGIGPVDVGMNLDQASAAAGTPIRLKDRFGLADECAYAAAADGPAGLLFMVEKGKIVRVDVGGAANTSPIRTVSGIGIGSTEADVQRTYAGRIKVTGHPYVPTGHYLMYTPADPSLAHLRLIFETDGQRVTSFRSGFAGPVSYIEGCA